MRKLGKENPEDILICVFSLWILFKFAFLDVDKDSQITEIDFQRACYMDPLLIQACGPCLPDARSTAAFLALVTDKYRNFTQAYHRHWVGSDQKKGSKNHSTISAIGISPYSSHPSGIDNILSNI